MIVALRHWLRGEGLRPSLVRSVIGSGGVQVAGMALTLLVGIQLAHELGVHGYGVYGLAMSVIAILGVPAQFGLPQLVTREVAAAEARRESGITRGVLRWSRLTTAWTSALVVLALLTWLWVLGGGAVSALGITLVAGVMLIPLVSFGSINCGALRGLHHVVKGQFPEIMVRPAAFALLLLAAHFLVQPLKAAHAMALGAVSAAVALAVSAVLLRRYWSRPSQGAVRIACGRAWWRAALPMALTEGMRAWQAQAAILFLGLMATVDVVGLYRVAASIAIAIGAPLALFNIVGMPYVARLHALGARHQLQRLLAVFALAMTLGVVVLSLPFFVAGASIIGFVFGAEFGGAAQFVRILCIGMIANGLFGASAMLLNMAGHERCLTRASAIAAGALCVLLPVLISLSGAAGAAWSVTIAMTLWKVLTWWDARRLLRLDTTFRPLLRWSFVHD